MPLPTAELQELIYRLIAGLCACDSMRDVTICVTEAMEHLEDEAEFSDLDDLLVILKQRGVVALGDGD